MSGDVPSSHFNATFPGDGRELFEIGQAVSPPRTANGTARLGARGRACRPHRFAIPFRRRDARGNVEGHDLRGDRPGGADHARPARAWQRDHARAWGLATECAPAAQLDERFETLLARIARTPVNQLVRMKLLVNPTLMAQGLHPTRILGTMLAGIARHTREGYAFQDLAMTSGFRAAVRARDEPFGDAGPSTFKG